MKWLVLVLAVVGVSTMVLADSNSFDIRDAVRQNGLRYEQRNAQQEIARLEALKAELGNVVINDISIDEAVDIPHNLSNEKLEDVENKINEYKSDLQYIQQKISEVARVRTSLKYWQPKLVGRLNGATQERLLLQAAEALIPGNKVNNFRVQHSWFAQRGFN